MGQINERTIKALKPPARGNRVRWDGELPGFGVRITAAGVVSFVLSYRTAGRKHRFTIGRYPELTATAARAEALTLRNDVRQGRDPLEAKHKERTEPTVSELAKRYLDEYAKVHKRATGLRNDRAMLSTIVIPRLGTHRLKAVSRRDVEAIHSSMKPTPYRANRVLSVLSKMFSLAIEWGWAASNPVHGIQRFHEDKREAWLTTDQLAAIEQALAAYPDQNAADSLRLIILTGSRAGEVMGAQWEQLDLKRATWTKPSHSTKQKKIEHVPLSDATVELLRRMGPKRSGPLFPGTNGDARVTLRRPWVQVCRAAGLTKAVEVKGKRRKIMRYKPTVRIHDLRHTYASHLVSSGVSLHIVGKLLGHTNPSTTQRYAHLADGALRDATNTFANMLAQKT